MPSRIDGYQGPERIELSGSPREIGLKHGTLLSSKIRSQISIYTAMFLSTSSLTWAEVRQISSTYVSTIQKRTPSIYEEIEGIAEGSGLDVLDIVALNCRSEIALGLFSDGCTSLGWRVGDGIDGGIGEDGEVNGGVEVVLAQNWDWTAKVKENLVFMRIYQVGLPNIWMVTEAGIVGKIGFNSSSVGTTLNAIRAKPTIPTKIPIHVALRVCLNSTSSSSAISALEELGGIASSAHILIADTTGPRSLELSPLGNIYIEPNEYGIVCHSNHFIKNKFVDEPPWLSGSPIRLERIQKITSDIVSELKEKGNKKVVVSEKRGSVGVASGDVNGELLRGRVFNDLFNAPQAICCQEDPGRPVETRSSTLFNIVMSFSRGKEPSAEVVWGRPGSGVEGEVLRLPW